MRSNRIGRASYLLFANTQIPCALWFLSKNRAGRDGRPDAMSGFCRVATLGEVREHDFALTPGRYVGSANGGDEDEPFDEMMKRLTIKLDAQFCESAQRDES